MTLVVRDWLERSMRLIGQLAAGESLSADDAADALDTASDMLDSWATERLTIYSQTRNAFALTAATQRYTLGTGGTWNQDRPLWIDTATLLLSNGQEYPIKVFTPDEWARISPKNMTATLPIGIFYNPTYPLGAVDVWPIASDTTAQIVLYSPLAPIKSVSSLDASLSIPDGWSKALRYNLAVDLAPEWGVEPSQAVFNGAIEAKANIQRVNEPNDEMRIDRALLPIRRLGSPQTNFDND